MATNSKIEWTDHTANLWWGCTKVHEGCDNCYANALAHRWGHDVWGNDACRRLIQSTTKELEKMQNAAENSGEIHRVFVGSMMDIFEKPMPMVDNAGELFKSTTGDMRDIFFEEIVPASPNLLFLLLTKRPSNINKYIPKSWLTHPPENVMFGATVVNQRTTDKVMEQLLKVRGRKFLSVEPQLEELTLEPWLRKNQIDWVIQGGESGPHKRPFDTDWARKLKAECKQTKTPYFFKQIDKVKPIPDDLMIRQLPPL